MFRGEKYFKCLCLTKKNFKAFRIEAYQKEARNMTISNQSIQGHFSFL